LSIPIKGRINRAFNKLIATNGQPLIKKYEKHSPNIPIEISQAIKLSDYKTKSKGHCFKRKLSPSVVIDSIRREQETS
jgi:hypothetical protein